MTKNKKAKQAARAVSKAGGIPYSAARRLTSGGSAGGGLPPAAVGGGWDEFGHQSLEELIAGSPQSACDQLIGESIDPLGSTPGDGISVDLELPGDLVEPRVHEFQLDDSTSVVTVADEYDGGTLACNVATSGTLTVEAMMAKADAIAAEASGLVRIFESDFNRHYSSVLLDVPVEAEFLAILNPDYGGIEDFTFAGAAALGL